MKVKISYQTLILPPPFAFGYTLDLDIGQDKVKVKYALEYLNRETITKEEIEEEGFTDADDFNWEGTLGKAWSEEMKSLKDIELIETSNDENIWMHFKIEIDGTERSGLTSDAELWDFRIQELIQAIYEKEKMELPLMVKLMHLKGGKLVNYVVEGAFESLTARINHRSVSWRSMQEAMSVVFSAELEPDGTKKPIKDGIWIFLDEEKAFFRLSINSKSEAAIIRSLDQAS